MIISSAVSARRVLEFVGIRLKSNHETQVSMVWNIEYMEFFKNYIQTIGDIIFYAKLQYAYDASRECDVFFETVGDITHYLVLDFTNNRAYLYLNR